MLDQVPTALRSRVVGIDGDEVHLALDDDRRVRVVVLSLGTVALGCLGAGMTAGGPVLPWVGLASVPVLSLIAMVAALMVGRPVVEIRVGPAALTVGTRRIPFADLTAVRQDGSVIWLDGTDPLPLHVGGEEPEARDALRAYLASAAELP